MSFRNFVPEYWSMKVDTALRSALIYGSDLVVNREYEGDIQNQGDSVKVTSVGRVEVHDYVPGPGGTDIKPEPINTGQRTFNVDQAKYWAVEVDDIDKRQAAMDVMPIALDEGGYANAAVMDSYVANLHTQIPASSNLGEISVVATSPTETEARACYDQLIVDLGIMLDERDVPEVGRYIILPPWLYGCIRRDDRFVEAHKSANAGALRTGQVGDASGFTILKSNRVPKTAADKYVITAGTNRAITFASQITQIEAYRPESGFSDAVKSLTVYGAKVMRPDAIVKAVAVRA